VNVFAPRFIPDLSDPDVLRADPSPLPPRPIGVLLVNLGTPDAPDIGAIRRYLRQFLSDPRVIERPAPWLWKIILYGVILPLRPHKLVPRYRDIWLENGSPLLVYSQAQADGLAQRLQQQGHDVRIALAMRYGDPSIPCAMDALRAQGCERILVVPLYPQYAASTTATAVDAVTAHAAKLRNQPELRFIKRYHTVPGYIDALAHRIKTYWQEHGVPERLLLSFHGLPRRTVAAGDPYHRDCMETTQALRRALGEHGQRVHIAFQSRFGREPWLQPYTKPTLQAWAREGVASVDVCAPCFLADCLETLEEIQVECRHAYLQAGGGQYRYISCLNDDPVWLDGLTGIVQQHLQGWNDIGPLSNICHASTP